MSGIYSFSPTSSNRFSNRHPSDLAISPSRNAMSFSGSTQDRKSVNDVEQRRDKDSRFEPECESVSMWRFMKQVADDMKESPFEKTLDNIDNTLTDDKQLNKLLLLSQFAVLNELSDMNKRYQDIMDDSMQQTKKRDTNEMKQHVASLTFQIITNGSIVAVFLGSMNVALLSYANDTVSRSSPIDDNQIHLPTSTQFSLSCWIISLLLSLIVVLIDSISAFLHLWETVIQHGTKIHLDLKLRSPFGKLDKTRKTSQEKTHIGSSAFTNSVDDQKQYQVHSHTDIQLILSLLSTVFNVLLTPALTSTLLGLVVFVWAQQPLLAAISLSSVGSLVCIGVVSSLLYLYYIGREQRSRIRCIYEKWEEERKLCQERVNRFHPASIAEGPESEASLRIPSPPPPTISSKPVELYEADIGALSMHLQRAESREYNTENSDYYYV